MHNILHSQRCLLLLLVTQLLGVLLSTVKESLAEVSYPEVCTGYSGEHEEWRLTGGLFMAGEARCEPGMAFMAYRVDPQKHFRDVTLFNLNGSCCPLPPDALTSEEKLASNECPEGFVVTGTKAVAKDVLRHYLICTKLNDTKYQLGQPLAGWEFGPGNDPLQALFTRPFTATQVLTDRAKIPISLRYGLLRTGRYTWEVAGCLGYPWGSLMTGRNFTECSGGVFRQLLLRGATAVPAPIYQPCSELDDFLSPTARCKE